MTPEQLAEIHAASFVTPRPWSAAEFADLMRGTGVSALSEAGAFALIRTIAEECEILTLAVAPDQRRGGIATRLVAATVKLAQSEGAVRVLLEVVHDNDAAIALYTKCGFKESGVRKDYYQKPGGKRAAALVMVRELEYG